MKRMILPLLMAAATLAMSAREISENFTLSGAEGMLNVELMRPDTDKTPLVIICHGFGGNAGEKLLTEISADLLADGVASVRFDFNGHGKSEGRFQDMTVPNEIQDLKNVVAWAQEQPWVESISLLGHSQGGVVASMAAGELGSPAIRSLVLMAPAAVLRDDALRGNTMGAFYDPWNMTEDYVQLPFGDKKLGRRYIESAIQLPIYETARNYTGPVLVIHGMADRVVPYTYGERYHQGYANSTLHLIPGDDHMFSLQMAETARVAANWLAKESK